METKTKNLIVVTFAPVVVGEASGDVAAKASKACQSLSKLIRRLFIWWLFARDSGGGDFKSTTVGATIEVHIVDAATGKLVSKKALPDAFQVADGKEMLAKFKQGEVKVSEDFDMDQFLKD